ncbi:hypothetical protein [Halorussus marinus]|nr:hypothetical protein [Halorussus marinus]
MNKDSVGRLDDPAMNCSPSDGASPNLLDASVARQLPTRPRALAA